MSVYYHKSIKFKTRLLSGCPLSSDPPPLSPFSGPKKKHTFLCPFFIHIPIKPEYSEMDNKSTNLQNRKMLLAKNKQTIFYILSEKSRLFLRKRAENHSKMLGRGTCLGVDPPDSGHVR